MFRVTLVVAGLMVLPPVAMAQNVGARGVVGCCDKPKRVQRLTLDKPGTYENFLVDGGWVDRNLVKITADGTTLKNCEVRNGKHNGIVVYAQDVVIDSCRIHHLLKGTFSRQSDAHGITGQPQRLTIRNCEIYYPSGDCLQFDPGRGAWTDVLVEHCTLWTGPLPAAAAGYAKGERPGENALDTKQSPKNARSQVTLRNCVFRGFRQPGTITNMAALNIKEHVRAHIENCVLQENEIGFRLRGRADGGGALVTIDRCAVYQTKIAVRMEDGLRDLKINRLGIGAGVERPLQKAGRGPWPGLEIRGEFRPPPVDRLLREGF